MKPKNLLIACFLTWFFVTTAHAQWRPVNADNFDVAGIKLGMSYEQAIKAAQTHFNLSNSDIKNQTRDEAAEMGLPSQLDNLIRRDMPMIIHIKNGEEFISMRFVRRAPPNEKDPAVLIKVSYSIPYTPQNLSAMKAAAIRKYGTPSAEAVIRGMNNVAWCPQPFRGNSRYVFACESSTHASLVLNVGSGIHLELSDQGRYSQVTKKYEDSLKTTKPRF